MLDEQVIAKIESHVADTRAKGATVLTGGKRLGARSYEPTVLANATAEMLCAREETFVAPAFRFETEADAIDTANATEFGLASYLCGDSQRRRHCNCGPPLAVASIDQS